MLDKHLTNKLHPQPYFDCEAAFCHYPKTCNIKLPIGSCKNWPGMATHQHCLIGDPVCDRQVPDPNTWCPDAKWASS